MLRTILPAAAEQPLEKVRDRVLCARDVGAAEHQQRDHRRERGRNSQEAPETSDHENSYSAVHVGNRRALSTGAASKNAVLTPGRSVLHHFYPPAPSQGQIMRIMNYIAFACFILLVGAARAQPELRLHSPPAEERIIPYSGLLPLCDDPSVLTEIVWNFRDRERDYWSSELAIAGFVDVREVGYRDNGPSYIPRRYCAALADFNDGLRRRVGYNLGERLGFSGFGWGVQWCVVGLDRDLSFAPACKMTGP